MEKISKLIRCAAKRWAEKRKNTDSPEQKTVETPERIETQVEKTRLQEHHKSEIEKLRNGCQAEIDKAIHRVEAIERQSKEKDTVIDKQRKQISLLYRKANPQRYSLSSGAELVRLNVPNYQNPSPHIRTRVGDDFFENIKFQINYDVAQRHFNGQITDEEFVNAVFGPQEQVNGKQAELLGLLSLLLSEGQQRFMSGQELVAHRLTFRGVNRKTILNEVDSP